MTTRRDRKIWTLKYVDPKSPDRTQENSGLTRVDALEKYDEIDPRWRKWVEKDGEVFEENDVQKEWRRRMIE